MKAFKSLLTNRYLYNSSMSFKSITKSESISKNPKVVLCGFKIGISKLH